MPDTRGAKVSCVDKDCQSSLIQTTAPEVMAGIEALPGAEVGPQRGAERPLPLPALPLDFAEPPFNPIINETVSATWTDGDGGGMSGGLLAGAVLGGAVVLGVVFAIFLFYKYRKYRKRVGGSAKPSDDVEAQTSGSTTATKTPGAISLTTQPPLASPFLKSITASTMLRRDPVLSWVASELASSDRPYRASSSSSQGSMIPSSPSGGGSGSYRTIDINEITVHRLIGEGSYGRVFAASWQQTPVAFKMLVDPKMLVDEEAAKKENARITAALEREAGLMCQLRHPNIVQFLGACSFPPGILTDWCSRGSLHEVLQQAKDAPLSAATQLTWMRRLNIALDACKGMLYLHGNKPAPVIHRDLKTANLLVTRDWTCKVADFNLSRLMEEHSRIVSSGGSGPGNPRWLAPEIFSGAQFTTATDVYAFGMVMYELLIWDVPFKGRHEWSIVGLVQGGERPELPPYDQLPAIPGEVCTGLEEYVALMRRAWAQDATERPAFEEITSTLRQLALAARP